MPSSAETFRVGSRTNRRLPGTDHLPLVYSRNGREPDITPYVAALAEPVTEGLVGAVGVSGVTSGQLEAARTVTDVVAAQVRIAHTLALGDHVLAIPGTGSVAHLEDNVAAGELHLGDDQLARLASSSS